MSCPECEAWEKLIEEYLSGAKGRNDLRWQLKQVWARRNQPKWEPAQ